MFILLKVSAAGWADLSCSFCLTVVNYLCTCACVCAWACGCVCKRFPLREQKMHTKWDCH